MRNRKEKTPAETPPETPEQERSRKLKDEADYFHWICRISTLLAAIVLCFTLLFTVMTVSGSSMYPTLHDGDFLLIRRIAYTPAQGDILVLKKESFVDEAIVKRCIAVAGQEVEIDYDTNTVYVDGVALEEDYLNFDNVGEEQFGSDYMVERAGMVYSSFVVPEGCIFVMGDNRNGSSDSRYAELGMVDTRCVIGRVTLMVRLGETVAVY